MSKIICQTLKLSPKKERKPAQEAVLLAIFKIRSSSFIAVYDYISCKQYTLEFDKNYMQKKSTRIYKELSTADAYQKFWICFKSVVNEMHVALCQCMINFKGTKKRNCALFLMNRLKKTNKEIDQILANIKDWLILNIPVLFRIHDLIFKDIAPGVSLYDIANRPAINAVLNSNSRYEKHVKLHELVANYSAMGDQNAMRALLNQLTAAKLKNDENDLNRIGKKNPMVPFEKQLRGGRRGRARGRGGRARGRGGRRDANRITFQQRMQKWSNFCISKGCGDRIFATHNGQSICSEFNQSVCNYSSCNFAHVCAKCTGDHALQYCTQVN